MRKVAGIIGLDKLGTQRRNSFPKPAPKATTTTYFCGDLRAAIFYFLRPLRYQFGAAARDSPRQPIQTTPLEGTRESVATNSAAGKSKPPFTCGATGAHPSTPARVTVSTGGRDRGRGERETAVAAFASPAVAVTVNPTGVNVRQMGAPSVFLTFRGLAPPQAPQEHPQSVWHC